MRQVGFIIIGVILLCFSTGCVSSDDDKVKDATQSDILIEISLNKEQVNISVEPFIIEVKITNIASHSVRITKNYRIETVYTIESPSNKIYYPPDNNITYNPGSMVLSSDESIQYEFVIENDTVKYLNWNEKGIYIIQVTLHDKIVKKEFFSNKVELEII